MNQLVYYHRKYGLNLDSNSLHLSTDIRFYHPPPGGLICQEELRALSLLVNAVQQNRRGLSVMELLGQTDYANKMAREVFHSNLVNMGDSERELRRRVLRNNRDKQRKMPLSLLRTPQNEAGFIISKEIIVQFVVEPALRLLR